MSVSRADVRTILGRLARRETTAKEVFASALRDARTVDAVANAFVYLLAEAPEEPAHAGKAAGLPTAYKDLHAYAGMPFQAGAPWQSGLVPSHSDAALSALDRDGWTPIGKTSAPQFGYPFWTVTPDGRAVSNPFNPRLTAGGSSGGAAAAVAGGVVPVAHASDGGGSIRVPAALCGVFGFKPSRGVVSQQPSWTSLTGYATHGAISRRVEDACFMLSGMPQSSYFEPFFSPLRDSTRRQHAWRRHLPTQVIGVTTENFRHATVDPVVLGVLEDTCRALERVGHTVVELPGIVNEGFGEDLFTVHRVGQSQQHAVMDQHTDELTDFSRWLRTWSEGVTLGEYTSAMRRLRQASADIGVVMQGVDMLLTPTLTRTAVPHEHFTAVAPELAFERMFDMSPFTAVYNVTGQPAASLPVTGARPPAVGMMLAGRPFADDAVLRVAYQLQQYFAWPDSFADLWVDLYHDDRYPL